MNTINNRRRFIKSSIAGGVALLAPAPFLATVYTPYSPTEHRMKNRPEVLFFDVNETLLDLEPLKKQVSQLLNNEPMLATLWFTTMLQYSLVMTVADQYTDFGEIGAATLQMVAENNGINITKEQAKEAIQPILHLQAHTDVKAALQRLKDDGYRLVSLTNSSNKAVHTQFDNAGLTPFFEKQMSIEDVGKYKPHTDAYHWAARQLGVNNEACMLVAAHGWDVAGAKWAGWQTAFVARPGQQLFPLAPPPDLNEPTLTVIAEHLCAWED